MAHRTTEGEIADAKFDAAVDKYGWCHLCHHLGPDCICHLDLAIAHLDVGHGQTFSRPDERKVLWALNLYGIAGTATAGPTPCQTCLDLGSAIENGDEYIPDPDDDPTDPVEARMQSLELDYESKAGGDDDNR